MMTVMMIMMMVMIDDDSDGDYYFHSYFQLSQGHFNNYLHYTEKKFYLLFLYSPIFTYFLYFV